MIPNKNSMVVSFAPFARFCEACPHWIDVLEMDKAGALKRVFKWCNRACIEGVAPPDYTHYRMIYKLRSGELECRAGVRRVV